MPLQFNRSRCTGCKLCQLACSAAQEKVFNPEKARLKITHQYDNEGINIASSHCIFCKECQETCPSGAISSNETHMIVDHDVCIGCGTCVETCPTDIVFLNGDEKSVICDLCQGDPQCVKWCPKEALKVFSKKKEVA